MRGGCVISQSGLSESEGRAETLSFTEFITSLLSACVPEPPAALMTNY